MMILMRNHSSFGDEHCTEGNCEDDDEGYDETLGDLSISVETNFKEFSHKSFFVLCVRWVSLISWKTVTR